MSICIVLDKLTWYFKHNNEALKYLTVLVIVKVTALARERSGSVIECLPRDREAAGLSITSVTALWFLSKTFTLA